MGPRGTNCQKEFIGALIINLKVREPGKLRPSREAACCWLLTVATGCWLLAAGFRYINDQISLKVVNSSTVGIGGLNAAGGCCRSSCWLVAGCGCWLWLLAAGCRLLAAGCRLLTGCRLLVAGDCMLFGCWLWLPAAGCWLGWLLAAGC